MLKDGQQTCFIPTVPIAEGRRPDAERLGLSTGYGGDDPSGNDDCTPTNRGQTVKLVPYAAWPLKEVSRAG